MKLANTSFAAMPRMTQLSLLALAALIVFPNGVNSWFANAKADQTSQLPLAPGAKFIATVDGKPFTANWAGTVQTTIAGKDALNVTGHVGEGADSTFINCSIVAPKVGSFPFGGSGFAKTSCSYHTTSDIFNGTFALKTGVIEITQLDVAGNTVSGTFSGSGKNMAGDKTMNVTDGHFEKIPLGQQSRLP